MSNVGVLSNTEISVSKKKIAALEKQKERLNYLFEKGRMEIEEYEKKYSDLEDQIADLKPQKEISYAKIKDTLSAGWIDMYNKLDAKHKKLFWHNLISKIIIDKNKEIIDIIFL